MDRQTIKKANGIIEKIKTLKREIDYLQEYAEKGAIIYFKEDLHKAYICRSL